MDSVEFADRVIQRTMLKDCDSCAHFGCDKLKICSNSISNRKSIWQTLSDLPEIAAIDLFCETVNLIWQNESSGGYSVELEGCKISTKIEKMVKLKNS